MPSRNSTKTYVEDGYYHIYNRGTNGENIFIEERNYDLFLKLYEKHISPVADTFAYCMLRNHFHVDMRVKSEEEIIETLSKKTLRVSSVNENAASGKKLLHNTVLVRKEKPLGSH